MAYSKMARTAATVLIAAGLLAACQSIEPDTGPTPVDAPGVTSRGEALAQTLCSSCHAVTRTDTSTHPEAPPLRHLARNYPVRHLEEALAEGIFVGHPDMPVFQLEPVEIDALLEYLESIQA